MGLSEARPLPIHRGDRTFRRLDFDRYVGIDYSGAKTPTALLKGLQIYVAGAGAEPVVERPPPPARNWSRAGAARWLRDRIAGGERLLVGIDHGFSFPIDYFERYRLGSWDAFLDDFCRFWSTDRADCTVDDVRDGSIWSRIGVPKPAEERAGGNTELRLVERWTSSAKSVFLFDVQGSVAKSTHAGLPWLRTLRREAGERVHVWPFDGWALPDDRSVIAEVYPSIFRHRFPREGRTADEQDAYAVARWLEESDRRGILGRYADPPLTAAERRQADLEGWILGIC